MNQSYELKDFHKLAGCVFFDIYKGDTLVERREFKAPIVLPKKNMNLIVEEGKTRIAEMLTGAQCDKFIKFIAVGTNPVAEKDSDKYAQIKASGRILREFVVAASVCPAVYSQTNPDELETPPVARFEITITENELVGKSIGELMLVFSDLQVMLARKSLGGLIEKQNFRIVIVWYTVIS